MRDTAPRKKAKRGGAREREGQATRRRILAVALDLWRREGPDGVGMRDIARAAGVSLGATYHHFASKDAIALALFEEHLDRHRALVADAIASEPSFAKRLAATLEASLDARAGDRVVLAFLAKVVLDSSSEASLFHPNTDALRAASIGVFQDVVDCEEIPPDARPLLAVSLWAMHLGVLLRFVLEETPGQPRTRALVRGIAELAPPLVALLASPMMISVRARLLEVLTQAGLDLEALTPAVASANESNPGPTRET